MLFFIFNNANIQFAKKKPIWRSYTITKVLPTTKWVEFINNKDFAKIALDENSETFVIHIVALETLLVGMTIYPSKKAQITL